MQEAKTSPVRPEKRSEKAGILNFSREMISALLMAFVFIIYVIQAFKIPTGSMENSLLVGDFLLGLKFVYGAPVLPFAYTKFPRLSAPKPGDVVIFEYPGGPNKDYIKRCVAGPGQVVETRGTRLLVDGREMILPARGQHTRNGSLGFEPLSNFAPLRVPRAGDTLRIEGMPAREFLFAKHLIRQEHPRLRLLKFLENTPFFNLVFSNREYKERVRIGLRLYVDGAYANDMPIGPSGSPQPFYFESINRNPLLNMIDDWIQLEQFLGQVETEVRAALPGREVRIERVMLLDQKPVERYVVKNDCYFMMGDNRDNSADSRLWGFLNRNHVKARAFIIYFSLNKDVPLALLPVKIRWNRLGKLIRAWNAVDGKWGATPVN